MSNHDEIGQVDGVNETISFLNVLSAPDRLARKVFK